MSGRQTSKHVANHKLKPKPVEHFHTLDKGTALLLRQIAEKQTVAIIKLHNLDVQIQELHSTQKKLVALVATLLADPKAREDALAVIKDFQFNKTQPR